jgi:hypothetical protein
VGALVARLVTGRLRDDDEQVLAELSPARAAVGQEALR